MPVTKLINGYPFIPFTQDKVSEEESFLKSQQFLNSMLQRRSIRYFSDKPVSIETMNNIISTANTAPSGANKQPWTFCLIKNAEIKRQIREAAEQEEYESYNGRMPAEWLADLAPLQTDWKKDFLEIAPWLIVVFKKSYDVDSNSPFFGTKNYFSS